jgi:hypothetical protein
MPVGEGVPIGGISLRTNLNLLLKAEIRSDGELPGEILEEAGYRSHSLPGQDGHGQES